MSLKMKDVHLRIPQQLYEFVERESAKKGISIALYLANLLRGAIACEAFREQQSLKEKEKTGEKISKETQKNPEPFHLEWIELTDEMLEQELKALETKYQLDSENFYHLYRQGKASESIEDRILWGSLYELKKEKDDLE